MPYEYRRMSPEERQAIVLARKEKGYPYHAPPHLNHGPGCFFISAACFEHAFIMATPERRGTFVSRFLALFKENGINPDAWVVLPNHYHFLTQVDDFLLLPPLIRRLHNGTSFEWNQEDGCSGNRKVWYQYFDRSIKDEAQYYEAINYIHFNPVKHGIVEDPYQWEWSSLGKYLEVEGRDWLRSTWSKYPPNKLKFTDFD
ncbi:MAG: transposase [Anaerolineaceae bacterium]